MCLGFKIFCCSSALLAFLWHPAAFGAAEKEGVTHRRGPLPFNVSDLFYNSNSLVGKKSLIGFGGKALRLSSKYYITSIGRISAILCTEFLPSLRLSPV